MKDAHLTAIQEQFSNIETRLKKAESMVDELARQRLEDITDKAHEQNKANAEPSDSGFRNRSQSGLAESSGTNSELSDRDIWIYELGQRHPNLPIEVTDAYIKRRGKNLKTAPPPDNSNKRLEKLKEITATQCSDGNYNFDHYMRGMANGMILSVATMENKEPVYFEASEIKAPPPDNKYITDIEPAESSGTLYPQCKCLDPEYSSGLLYGLCAKCNQPIHPEPAESSGTNPELSEREHQLVHDAYDAGYLRVAPSCDDWLYGYELYGEGSGGVIDTLCENAPPPEPVSNEICDDCNGAWQGVNEQAGEFKCYHCSEKGKHKYAVKIMKTDLVNLATEIERLGGEVKRRGECMETMWQKITKRNQHRSYMYRNVSDWFDSDGKVKSSVEVVDKTCEFTNLNDEYNNYFDTECGGSFSTGDPLPESEYKFCPYCGGKIKTEEVE